jgi:hypothetical protein
MDYAEMNLASWASYLTRFKDLLRPAGAAPLGMPDEAVEAVRSDDSAQMLAATISAALPDVVFEGYGDWYSNPDEWVLRNLGHVLTAGEEDQILSGLDQGTPDALHGVLDYVAGRLGTWRDAAQPEAADVPELLEGVANTDDWMANRIPATYYYTQVGERYLYSDLAEGPMSEWETLAVRKQLAADNAEPWGESGWFWTFTGEPDLYGGPAVYAANPSGPWMTEDEARAVLASQYAAGSYEADSAAEAITEASAVDLSTREKAQDAAHDVAEAAQEILDNVLSRNPELGDGIDPERMKQLVIEALKAVQ